MPSGTCPKSTPPTLFLSSSRSLFLFFFLLCYYPVRLGLSWDFRIRHFFRSECACLIKDFPDSDPNQPSHSSWSAPHRPDCSFSSGCLHLLSPDLFSAYWFPGHFSTLKGSLICSDYPSIPSTLKNSLLRYLFVHVVLIRVTNKPS